MSLEIRFQCRQSLLLRLQALLENAQHMLCNCRFTGLPGSRDVENANVMLIHELRDLFGRVIVTDVNMKEGLPVLPCELRGLP